METETKPYMLPRSWVDRIFIRMGEIYGDRWKNMWEGVEEIAKDEWAMALYNMSSDEIKRALEGCKKSPRQIPTPIQFCGLGRFNGVLKPIPENKPMQVNKEQGQKHIEEILKQLYGSENVQK